MSFEKFDLSNELMMGLKDLRYSEPTPIQEECIPLILDGKDVIGAAQTGTGKTGAFVIPLLQKITQNKSDDTQALILSPTRELAQQIEEQIFALGYHTGITSATVTGGSDYGTQVKAIRAGVDIIVATPGRLIDQMNVLNLDFSGLEYLVLDEADRMLDMGFLPDVMKIVEQLPKERQTMLFSATMVEEVQKVVDQVMVDPVEVEFEVSKPADSVDQQIYFVHPKKKLSLFEQLFDADKYKTAIVFCATKRGTDEVERMLKKRGVNAVSMHGDRDQQERNEALRLFKNKTHPVMVATDVLSRGIDIDDVSLIVNFDVPNNPEDYIHRIGRTGRYDKEGTAITFVSNKDKKYYHAIKNVVGDQLTVKEIPDESSPKVKEKKERTPKKESRQESKQQEKKEKKKKKPVSREESKFAKESEKKKDKQTKKQKKETEDPEKQESKQKPKQKKERKPRPSGSKGRSQRQKKSENGKPGNKKSSPKKNDSARSGKNISIPKHIREAEQEEDIFQPEIIEKAVSRNKKSLKPAKGIWGVIKSLIPKL
ncbi:DEAD/DEAH box helicase [Fodinibius sp. AD559]|uniref:DEAD/DEAH box helicase n=1 Tax=Fodinibius sp. AD559 TaxID=3424179 RepID=UPI00404689DE